MLPLSGRDATPDNASAKADGLPDIIIRDGGDYATEEDSPSHYPQSKKRGAYKHPFTDEGAPQKTRAASFI